VAAVSYYQGKLDAAERYWEEAGEIFRALGDHLIEALTVGNLGAIAADRGEFDRAERLQQRALELQRRLGNAPNIALALVNLGDISCHLGDYTLASDLLAEAIPMLHELGHKDNEGIALHHLAEVALGQADLPRAAFAILQSMQLLSEVGDQLSIGDNVDLLAKICAARGDHNSAIEFMGAASALRERLGSKPNPVSAAELANLQQSLREAVRTNAFDRHWRIGADLDFDVVTNRLRIVAREIVGPRQPQLLVAVPDAPVSEHNLTNREIEVLRLLTEGRSTREISETMFISPRTATTHINNIFGKLEVNSRIAAVAWAMRAGVT
jgi:ATP/maltotriose-dependent transcriptional regulator MalT